MTMFDKSGRLFLPAVLILLFTVHTADAQELGEISEDHEPEVPDTLQGWDMSWVAELNVAQAAYSNWSKGGVNSYHLNSLSRIQLMYKMNRFSYDFEIRTQYGQARIQREGMRKTDDRLRLRNRFLYDVSKDDDTFKLFGNVNFETQFGEGFDYDAGPEGEDVLISDFFAPAYFNQNAGLAYFPDASFSVEAGLGLKQTVIQDTTLSTRYGLQEGQTFRVESGIALGVNYKKEIMENVIYEGYVETFTNIQQSIRRTNIFFNSQFTGEVNSYINVIFQLELIYNPDFSNRMQVAQSFSAGISLNLY